MQTFKDSAGRTWQIPGITVAAIGQIRKNCSITLCNLLDGNPPLVRRLDEDMPLMAAVVFELIGDQAKKVGVSLEQFQAALDGPAVAEMGRAFWQEVFDFFLACRPAHARLILESHGVSVPSGTSSSSLPATSESTQDPTAATT